MTDEQINAAIAEACGWDHKPVNCGGANYCTDLNAIHEAERTLKSSLQSAFIYELWEITNTKTLGAFENISATARQRAEAFLRTLGKWEEAE